MGYIVRAYRKGSPVRYLKTNMKAVASMDKISHVVRKATGVWETMSDARQAADMASRIMSPYGWQYDVVTVAK